MENNKSKNISANTYSDGPAEDELLSLFQKERYQLEINGILDNNPTWVMRYHLSPIRHNLLSWYEFNPESTLLEVGAGCGALTGLFCSRVKKVIANELSEKRAQIIKARCNDFNNLEIICGNIKNIKITQKFDYVSCIGVLEYAGKYFESKDPFLDFLKLLRKFLKTNGKLILAIENKFGLKYWSGAVEDHTGNLFDSIEGYPNNQEIMTFGKEELSSMLRESGYNQLEYYFPLPDYKLPEEIFSEHYLPTIEHNIKSGLIPFPDYAHNRKMFFNEKLVMDNIIKNNNFPFFANSFLIFAS